MWNRDKTERNIDKEEEKETWIELKLMNSDPNNYFQNLPEEIKKHVLSFLPNSSVGLFQQTNKASHELGDKILKERTNAAPLGKNLYDSLSEALHTMTLEHKINKQNMSNELWQRLEKITITLNTLSSDHVLALIIMTRVLLNISLESRSDQFHKILAKALERHGLLIKNEKEDVGMILKQVLISSLFRYMQQGNEDKKINLQDAEAATECLEKLENAMRTFFTYFWNSDNLEKNLHDILQNLSFSNLLNPQSNLSTNIEEFNNAVHPYVPIPGI